MSNSKNKTNMLKSDFTEDAVAFAFEFYLTFLSFPFRKFSIEPISRTGESKKGFDVIVKSKNLKFSPFYIQFKRPYAYTDLSHSQIISDRKTLNLTHSPYVLFFKLHRSNNQNIDFQHNVLFSLRQNLLKNKNGDAVYVCPLHLILEDYRSSLHQSALFRHFKFWNHIPFYTEEIFLNEQKKSLKFDRIPFFAQHITIPPHATVSNANHYYSFTKSGKEVCFHSPLALPDYNMSLADFLKSLSQDFLNDGTKIGIENANDVLRQMIHDVLGDFLGPDRSIIQIGDDSPILSWFKWGDFLRREFNIEQYAFVQWDD